MTRQKRSREDIILTCKEGGCPWDFRNAPFYEWQDRYGRKWWMRRVRCRDCGSTKFRKYQPRLPLEPAGSWKYERTPGWYDAEFKFYWQNALEERLRYGQIQLPEGVR